MTSTSGHEKLTMAQALNRALRDAMTADGRGYFVRFQGGDVWSPGGRSPLRRR